MNKNILFALGGLVAGVVMTLATACLIPEEYFDYRKDIF